MLHCLFYVINKPFWVTHWCKWWYSWSKMSNLGVWIRCKWASWWPSIICMSYLLTVLHFKARCKWGRYLAVSPSSHTQPLISLSFCLSVSVDGSWAWLLWSPVFLLAPSWWLMPSALLPKLPWGLSCWRRWTLSEFVYFQKTQVVPQIEVVFLTVHTFMCQSAIYLLTRYPERACMQHISKSKTSGKKCMEFHSTVHTLTLVQYI